MLIILSGYEQIQSGGVHQQRFGHGADAGAELEHLARAENTQDSGEVSEGCFAGNVFRSGFVLKLVIDISRESPVRLDKIDSGAARRRES